MTNKELLARIDELEVQLAAQLDGQGTTLTKNDKVASRGGIHVAYLAPGSRKSFYFPRVLFVGEPPTTIQLPVTLAHEEAIPRKKMADMTPAERATHARAVADAARARAEALEAKLAAQ